MKNTIILAFALGLIGTAFADFTCSVKVSEGEVGASRTATATYAGGGAGSPLVRVEAGDGAYVRFSEADGWSKSVEFLALGGDGTQDFFCLADDKDAKLELSYTVGSSEAIPWTTLGSSLKPSYVSADAWAYAEQELESRLGATWNAYLARLKANADYLANLGYVTKRTDRLLALEINRALGVNAAVPTLASATDISRSARGLPLAFSRSYSSAMYAHFNCGALGYGWTDNYLLYAELADETTLAIRLPSGGSYSFSKVTGTWQPEDARDVTKLTETSDAYVLSYENGMVQTFDKSNMRLKTIADNVGNTLTFAYDGGRGATALPTQITHSDGQYLKFAYNDDGLLTSVMDDIGNQVSYTYDADRQLKSVTGTDGLVTAYEYQSENDIIARALRRITYPDKTTLDFMYVTTGTHLALDSITPSACGTTSFYYPDVGTIQITSPDGGVTEIAMGPSGEVLKTTDALGNVVTRTYDGDGLLQSILAPSGKSGQYAYDARGRVTTQTSAAGNKTTFDYTELFGNLKTLKDAKNQSVTYGYDDKGRATSVIFPDGAKMLVAYNEKGDVAKTTNCRGQSETYGYDAEGRVTSRTWANGRTFTYAYDAKGRLVTATDSVSGKVTMTYDHHDRLTKITYPGSTGFTFAYDLAGRLTKRAALDGTAECYTYDSAGRVSEVTDGNGGLYLRNTYEMTTGQLIEQAYGNGTVTEYAYDLCGRITSIVHKDAAGKITESLQYCYDEDGRCIRAASLLGEERYTYDDDGQLTGVTYPVGENESFVYDAAGNRTSANGATYTVNSLNQYTALTVDAESSPRQNETSSTSFTYDADGNLTSKTDATGTTTYTYDQQNRLIAVSNPTTKLDWSCTYDVLGNRVSVTTNGVTTTRVMLPGALPSVAAEYQNNKLIKRHIVVGATQIADIDAAGHSNYYHGDLIGSTRLITDQTGATVNRLSYKAFGEVHSSMTRRDSASTSATPVDAESLRVTPTAGYVGTLGVETDPTGLLFMRNRYYDPPLGRFLQRDPIGLSGGDANWYRYCGNSVCSYADINGLIVAKFKSGLPHPLRQEYAWNSVHANAHAKSNVAYSRSAWIGPVSVSWGRDEDGVLDAGLSFGLGIGVGYVFSDHPYDQNLSVSGILALGIGGEAYKDVRGESGINGVIGIGASAGVNFNGFGHAFINTANAVEHAILNRMENKKKITVSIGGGSTGGGTGGGSTGGGSIMSEDDWLDITTNEHVNAQTTTFSLGADVTLHDYQSIVKNFSGTVNGNGHTLKSSITAGVGVVFPYANKATFNNVKFGGGVVRYSEECCFVKCSTENASIGDEVTSGTFTQCHATYAPMVGKAINCTFINCTANVIGGAGRGSFANEATDGCKFLKCSATGDISTEYNYGGGIVGKSLNSTFENCRSSVNVTGGSSIGCFAGYLSGGSVSGCFASGIVVGTTSKSDFGGFAGTVRDSATISGCAATGNVSAPTASVVGGFAGLVRGGTFQNCYACGSVEGGDAVGGFVGNPAQSCSLMACYATGDVMANGMKGSGHVGGLSGMSDAGTGGFSIKNCYARGAVVNNNSGILTYSGGLSPLGIAAMYLGMAPASQIEATMIVCEGCYWNKDTTGQIYSGMGTKGLTNSEMAKTGNFSGWDFVTTWAMGSDGPYLRALGKTGVIPVLAVSSAVAVKSARSDGASLKSLSAKATSSATSGSPNERIYSFNRYVLVKGYTYSFLVSSDGGAAVSVSGLPDGLVFADGCVTGKVAATGTSSVTITAGGETKTVKFEVIDSPTGFAAQYKSAGGVASEEEDPGDDPGTEEPLADGYGYTEEVDGYTWTFSEINGEAVIGVCDENGTALDRCAVSPSPSGVLAIPGILGGCPVVSIADGCVAHVTNLTSVVIPSTVTNVGAYAFFGCSNLRSVAFSEGLKAIGSGAFAKCAKLTDIVLPPTVRRVGERLATTNAVAVVVTGDVTSNHVASASATEDSKSALGNTDNHGYGAFEDCASLTNVILNTGLEVLGAGTFKDCISLEQLEVPESVRQIGGRTEVFSERTSSDVLTLTDVQSQGGNVSSLSQHQESLSESRTQTRQGAGFLEGCTALKAVMLPSALEYLGPRAFANCTSLTHVDLPASLPVLYDGTFIGCERLTSVGFSSDLELVGGQEPTYTITENLSSNAQSVNGGTLSVIAMRSYASVIGRQMCGGQSVNGGAYSMMNYEIADDRWTANPAEALIDSDASSMNDWLEDWPGFDVLTDVGYSITGEKDEKLVDDWDRFHVKSFSTGRASVEGVFRGCSSLREVILPQSVRRIADNSFMDCSSLTKLSIPTNVWMIGQDVFGGSCAPKDVTAPWLPFEALKTVLPSYELITNLVLVSGPTEIVSPSFVLRDVIRASFGQDWNLDDLTARGQILPVSAKNQIADRCLSSLWMTTNAVLSGFRDLQALTLPEGVVRFDSTLGLSECPNLVSLNLPASLTEIGDDALDGFAMLKEIAFGGRPLKTLPADAFADLSAGCVGIYLKEYSDDWARVIDRNGMWNGLKMKMVGDSQREMQLIISPGWNWISLNVTPTNDAIGAVFAGVTFADEDVIKSAEGSATYYGGKWYGELTAIKPGVAYMVKMSAADSQTLTVTGSAAATSVDVASGWNWIGPTATAEISLDALNHSGGFTDEDVIKSEAASATYYGGKWYGELKSLQPGLGYKARFVKDGTLTFGDVAK